MANLFKHRLPATKVSNGGAEISRCHWWTGLGVARQPSVAPEDETLAAHRRRLRRKTPRLELYLRVLRLIGALAAVNTVPPRGDGPRLRAAELMTALKRRRSIVFPCGLRFTQSGGRDEAKPQKGAFFFAFHLILGRLLLLKERGKKEKFTNICGKPLTLTLTNICSWQVGLIILSAGVEVGKRLWSRLNT